MIAPSRRGFLGSALATALVPFVRPAPRPRIDLMQFCGRPDQLPRYDVTLPHMLGGHTFATDTKVCVRVAADPLDAVQNEGRPPPFHSLPWRHDDLRGWRTLPAPRPLLADDSNCPACEGTGNRGGVPDAKCDECGGCGAIGGRGCNECHRTGRRRPGTEACLACGGKAVGVFPSVVEVGGQFYAVELYEKVARLGGEYVTGPKVAGSPHGVMMFRFDGGEGMLMPIRGDFVRPRLVG